MDVQPLLTGSIIAWCLGRYILYSPIIVTGMNCKCIPQVRVNYTHNTVCMFVKAKTSMSQLLLLR